MTTQTPSHRRLDAWQGVDFDFEFTLYEEDGATPLDLTGHTVDFVAAPRGLSVPLITLTESAGLTLTHVDGVVAGHIAAASMGGYRAGLWDFHLRDDGTLPIDGLLVVHSGFPA